MKTGLALALLLWFGSPLDAQVLDRRSFQLPPYDELPVAMRQVQREDRYDRLRSEKSVVFEQFSYLSSGLRINAFIARPATVTGRLPVVIYCRPGVGEAAAIGLLSLHNFYEIQKYAAAGFLVIASQFRGTGGSEGRDEIGGADLADVMQLRTVIAAMPEADGERIVMAGSSRGAQMALQAARAGFPVKAIAAVGVPTDWGAMLERSPQQINLVRDAWPEFDKRREEHVTSRSAIRWVDEINTPLLIFQGTRDEPVPTEDTLAFARELQRKGKTYELLVYQGDDHLVITHRDERIARAIEWFNKYLAPSSMVVVKSRDFAFELPRQVPAGRVTFEMSNEGAEPHYLRIMRMEGEHTFAELQEWRKQGGPAPAWLRPHGGLATIAPGTTASYTSDLAEGRYAVLCGHPSPDGVQHVDKGMLAVITASGPSAPVTLHPPAVALTVADQKLTLDRAVRAGPQTWHVWSNAKVAHQAMVIALPQGVTAEQELAWFRAGSRGPRPGRPLGGVIDIAPGQRVETRLNLPAGRYIMICSIPDSAQHRHFDRGELVAFEIDR